MKESIGTSFIINIIAVFLATIGILMIGFFGYSRAYKTKDKVIDIIEKYEGYTRDAEKEIEDYYKTVGYGTKKKGSNCKNDPDASAISNGKNYRYCIYKYDTGRGSYYSVTVYMTYNFPIIQSLIQIPVSGETKIIYEL